MGNYAVTPDYRPRWYVMVGNCYIAGLGKTFAGYQNKSGIPQTPGFVITLLERRAMMFTSLDSARKLADSIGGCVIMVNLGTEKSRPGGTGTAPRETNHNHSNERG